MVTATKMESRWEKQSTRLRLSQVGLIRRTISGRLCPHREQTSISPCANRDRVRIIIINPWYEVPCNRRFLQHCKSTRIDELHWQLLDLLLTIHPDVENSMKRPKQASVLPPTGGGGFVTAAPGDKTAMKYPCYLEPS
jgi:hypothetical protein